MYLLVFLCAGNRLCPPFRSSYNETRMITAAPSISLRGTAPNPPAASPKPSPNSPHASPRRPRPAPAQAAATPSPAPRHGAAAARTINPAACTASCRWAACPAHLTPAMRRSSTVRAQTSRAWTCPPTRRCKTSSTSYRGSTWANPSRRLRWWRGGTRWRLRMRPTWSRPAARLCPPRSLKCLKCWCKPCSNQHSSSSSFLQHQNSSKRSRSRRLCRFTSISCSRSVNRSNRRRFPRSSLPSSPRNPELPASGPRGL